VRQRGESCGQGADLILRPEPPGSRRASYVANRRPRPHRATFAPRMRCKRLAKRQRRRAGDRNYWHLWRKMRTTPCGQSTGVIREVPRSAQPDYRDRRTHPNQTMNTIAVPLPGPCWLARTSVLGLFASCNIIRFMAIVIDTVRRASIVHSACGARSAPSSAYVARCAHKSYQGALRLVDAANGAYSATWRLENQGV
jgi:hypothetical protein